MSESPAAPDAYTVVLKPRLTDGDGRTDHGNPLRSVRVTATGRVGESGYPRYEGDGVQADIDPRTRTVEAVTFDGEEIPYGYVAEADEA
ncbi:hypothetical protein [Streptomyces sp. NPDC052225]|uniref:hypothetical protein n=1 Tax=Streptomyces sp. NPDC052225 TaxID=3154949 RepID=UPI00344627E2